MWYEVWFEDITLTIWPTTYAVLVCSVHDAVCTIYKPTWPTKYNGYSTKGSTTNLILLLNFLVVTTQSAWFATGRNIEKTVLLWDKLWSQTRTAYRSLFKKISKSIRKWNLRFCSHGKIMRFNCLVWNWWSCLKLRGSFLMQCTVECTWP